MPLLASSCMWHMPAADAAMRSSIASRANRSHITWPLLLTFTGC
jgi:hypothetical protein